MEISYSFSEIKSVVNQIIEESTKSKIFCFEGTLGAGKTTLIEEMCSVLGSRDTFSSPTYSIINEYALESGSIIHADLYRLNSIEEIMDIGLEDYLYAGKYCFIEWYQLAEEMIPRPYYLVRLSHESDATRHLSIELIS